MIFVTVGTHEQPFNRLIEEVDRLKGAGEIEDEVIIQRGYSTYKPKHCLSYDMLSYEDMEKYMREARIIITHGGPASFIAPLSLGKIPIVVPRQAKYHEHVNDHQLEFCRQVAERMNNIILVEDVKILEKILQKQTTHLKRISSEIFSNNQNFNKQLREQIELLFGNRNEFESKR